jgi:hypothetical protein
MLSLVTFGLSRAEPFFYGFIIAGALAFAIEILRRASDRTPMAAKDVIAMVRDLTILLATVLFFVGFVYRYAYFFTLGVPSRFGDASVNEILVYSYSVLTHDAFAIVVGALLVLVVVAAARRIREVRGWSAETTNRILLTAGAIAAFLTFPTLYNLASMAGREDGSENTKSVNSIRVCLRVKAAADTVSDQCMSVQAARTVDPYGYYPLLLASDGGYLFKLDESKDDYFFTAIYKHGMQHFRLPKSTVALVHD